VTERAGHEIHMHNS